ncbi:MAG: hypothetical protein AB1446_10050 [Bacillota bacterium]
MKKSVFVLGTVHDGHGKYPGYTYWHLIKILAAYGPDLVCIEVGPRRFMAGDFRCDSAEKWGIGLGWAWNRGVPVAPVDGDGKVNPPEDAQAALAFEASDEGRRILADLERRCSEIIEEAGGFEPLVNTYDAANSQKTCEVFRATHELVESTVGHIANGAITWYWAARNQGMAAKTVQAMDYHEASRAIVLVGCEHKYALDDLLGERYHLTVLQLEDFLAHPITLTDQERDSFHRGDHPLFYPSDLMYIHTKVHGGEPYSYMQTLPPNPDSLNLSGVMEKIERHLSDTPGDPDMLYYRGIYRYLTKDYSQAIEDFSAVADDCTRRVGGLIPLWELATLRKGQMLDLLGEREAALRAYQKVAREGTGHLKDIVSSFLKEPFTRPLPGPR